MIAFTEREKQMRKSKGFFLAEAILSVMITVLIVLTLQQLLLSLKKADQSKANNNEIAFAYVQLDHFLGDNRHAQVFTNPARSNSRQAVFTKRSHGQSKKYYIEQYEDLLRVRTSSGGHMPLLLHVKTAHFATGKRLIRIRIIEEDQRCSELVFKLEGKNEKD